MAMQRNIDNQLRKLNKRVTDARKIIGINSSTYQLMQREMLAIDAQLKRETGKSFLRKSGGAWQFVRSKELLKHFDENQIDAMLQRLEAIGTVGKEAKAIKKAAKAMGEDVKKIDLHEWANKKAKRNALLDYAFEYLYSLDDEETQAFFDSIRNREYQEDTEQRALELFREKIDQGAKAAGGRRGKGQSYRTKEMAKHRRLALKARSTGDLKTAKEQYNLFLEVERGKEEGGQFRRGRVSPRELDLLFEDFLQGRG